MIGPGVYDQLCTTIREATDADGCILLIFNGTAGNGASIQVTEDIMPLAPAVLRQIADDIEADIQAIRNGN